MKTGLPRAGTLASAILIVVSHPPLEWHPLIWIGAIPWLLTLLRCASWRAALLQGFWLGFLLGLGGAFWVAVAVPGYLGLSFSVGVVATVLHALVHQLQLAAFAPVFRSSCDRSGAHLGGPTILGAAFAYTFLDWIIPNLFRDTFGFVLHNYPALSQAAELGGAPLLTFLVIFVNLSLFAAIQACRAEGVHVPALARVLGPAVVLLLACWAFGEWRLRELGAAIDVAPRRVAAAVVQANVSDELKVRWAAGDPAAAETVLDIYLEASQQLLRKASPPDVIVWPETAYPGIFRRPENEAQAKLNVRFDRFIARSGTPFVFGAYDREDRRDVRLLRNAIFFVEPGSDPGSRELPPMQVYHKRILFPVGETLPLVARPTARRLLPAAGAFTAGEGARSVNLTTRRGEIRVGPSICYEDLFAAHAIELAREGAELMVNVSNDSWFGNYGLPQFHLIAAKLRSIETRLPQVRATNTGYSGLILQTGQTIGLSDYGRRQALEFSVPILAARETWMVRFGDWFALACALGWFGVAAIRWAGGDTSG